jgi:hypothetical protein
LQAAADAIRDGATVLILSDRGVDAEKAPIPALLAVAGVHHHLIRQGLRNRCGLVVESAEPREVHHFCCLLGYGAAAVNPYLVYATFDDGIGRGQFPVADRDAAIGNYNHAIEAGILKVMSKNGISTLQSYQGAQIFECLGLDEAVVERFFSDTATRIGGADLERLTTEVLERHRPRLQTVGRRRCAHAAVGGQIQVAPGRRGPSVQSRDAGPVSPGGVQ